ncbi:MAG: hypothetical protein ABIQ95_14605 [Bdellovibrionia bacterium]
MNKEQAEKTLNKYYLDWLSGGDGEAVFFAIDEILKDHPDCLQVFINRFVNEANNSEKETLAQIILRHSHYEPAINFLKVEMGWNDFSGFVGFPEN